MIASARRRKESRCAGMGYVYGHRDWGNKLPSKTMGTWPMGRDIEHRRGTDTYEYEVGRSLSILSMPNKSIDLEVTTGVVNLISDPRKSTRSLSIEFSSSEK
jgi:hypothetical protein